jgi:dihydropteridine reductase
MPKNVLVYGANGALGRIIVSKFKQNHWIVTSVDLSVNPECNHLIQLDQNQSPQESYNQISDKMTRLLGTQKLDAIVNVAGGWAGGNLLDKDLFTNFDLMMKQSVLTSIISAKLAAEHLKPGGLLVLTGAGAAIHGTPSMMAYGMAKSAVHHLIKSCAGPGSGIPAGGKVVGILPITLDTPMNRKFMSDGDTSTWTPLSHVSDEIYDWATEAKQVQCGGLYKLVTEHSKTSFVPVD